MPRGRPPKPKLHQPGDKPRPLAGVPKAPRHLSSYQKKVWRELIRVLGPSGLLTQADTFIMESFCVACETSREARAWLAAPEEKHWGRRGKKVMKGKNGSYQNPWLAVFNRAEEQKRQLGERLGLDPSARERLNVTDLGPHLQDDPKARFFKARESAG